MLQNQIEAVLIDHFSPTFVAVENESHQHASGKGGNSHFKITLVSDRFTGQALIQRHRSVQQVLQVVTAGVHAVGLHTYTPDEWLARGEASPVSPTCAGAKAK